MLCTMNRAMLQTLNGLLFVAQLLTIVACFVTFIASTHTMHYSTGPNIDLFWNHVSRGGDDIRYRDLSSDVHGAALSTIGDHCYNSGNLFFTFSLLSLLILLFNLAHGVIRVMDIPEEWLKQYVNTDTRRWIRKEIIRQGCVLVIFGIGLIAFGSTCIRTTVDELGSAAPPLRPEAGSLRLTGFVYSLVCWFLLAISTLFYIPIFRYRDMMYSGVGARRHAREEEEEGQGGAGAHDDNEEVASSPKAGLTPGGLRRSSVDGGDEAPQHFTHPDSLPPAIQTNLPSNITLGALHASPKPPAAAVASPVDLNLDHVLKIDEEEAAAAAMSGAALRHMPDPSAPYMHTDSGLPPYPSPRVHAGSSAAGSQDASTANSRRASTDAQFMDISLASPHVIIPTSTRHAPAADVMPHTPATPAAAGPVLAHPHADTHPGSSPRA